MTILLGNKEIKSLSDPGIIADILANIKDSEYQEKQGSLHSFIPDTGTGAANDIPVAASWTSVQSLLLILLRIKL